MFPYCVYVYVGKKRVELLPNTCNVRKNVKKPHPGQRTIRVGQGDQIIAQQCLLQPFLLSKLELAAGLDFLIANPSFTAAANMGIVVKLVQSQYVIHPLCQNRYGL